MASGSRPHDGRRTRLRNATTAAHRRLDSFVEEAGFLSARDNYLAYVSATWRARRPLERMLDAASAVEIYTAWPRRRISDALAADLRDLSAPPPEEPPPPRASAATSAAILGTLYVLEGSALGARLLGGRVGAIGMGPDHGARHIARQAEDPRAWGRFVEVLETTPMNAADEDLCVEAARAAFADFERCYRQACLPR